jgi:hypothetical protein
MDIPDDVYESLLASQFPGLTGLQNALGAARTATEVQLQAAAAANTAYGHITDQLSQSLLGYAAQYSAAQGGVGASCGQMGQQAGIAGQNGPNLGEYADAKNRRMQHERALGAMNSLAREKYEPVFQLMGISLKAPWILSMSLVSHPIEWTMEIDLDGKTYRHVWDMLSGEPAEWDAEVGYLLDKVARLRQSLLPPEDAGEPEPVLGSVSGPARGSVAGGSGRDGSGETGADTTQP